MDWNVLEVNLLKMNVTDANVLDENVFNVYVLNECLAQKCYGLCDVNVERNVLDANVMAGNGSDTRGIACY